MLGSFEGGVGLDWGNKRGNPGRGVKNEGIILRKVWKREGWEKVKKYLRND